MQMIQQNLAYILGGTLLFLVCSSKNILIYNEELLIALSFLAFIATSAHTMGDAIAETFQTRADQIQTELQAFFVAKETLYQEVKHQIQMQQTLAQSMTALGTLVQHQLQDLHTQRAKLSKIQYKHVQSHSYNTWYHNKMQYMHTCIT